jgi:ATP-dependent Clp protease ATP-binding subunit ClpC
MFLQVFDEGRLTDSKGRTADARNAIFIMTSNIQADRPMGFGFPGAAEPRQEAVVELGKHFRREFLNRIDDTIVFRSLDEADVRRILKPILKELVQSLKEQQQVTLVIQPEAEQLLARAGYSTQYGVRELARTVERMVQAPLSRLILNGTLAQHKRWQMVCQGEELAIIPLKRGTRQKETE